MTFSAQTFSSYSFSNDPLSYIHPTWQELHDLTYTLSRSIVKQTKHRSFDRLVTLAKGGWPMARLLADFLSLNTIANVGIQSYKGIAERSTKPTIVQDLGVSVEGEHLLVCDDVADTGVSLSFVKEFLLSRNAASVTTATQFYKKRSMLLPDYYGVETDAWIIFPYEVFETIVALRTRWRAMEESEAEIAKRLERLGFSREVQSDCIELHT